MQFQISLDYQQKLFIGYFAFPFNIGRTKSVIERGLRLAFRILLLKIGVIRLNAKLFYVRPLTRTCSQLEFSPNVLQRSSIFLQSKHISPCDYAAYLL